MSPMLKSDEAEPTDSRIEDLSAVITEAENQILNCRRMLAEEQQQLEWLKIQLRTEKGSEYLKAASRACRAGIKAWKLSIAAYKSDVDECRTEIEEILNKVAKANGAH